MEEIRIAVEWMGGRPAGRFEVSKARLVGSSIVKGEGKAAGEEFAFLSEGACRVELTFDVPNLTLGADGAVVTVRTEKNPFSFFLRDVSRDYPIFIPAYGVVVTETDDARSYEEVELITRSSGLQTVLGRFESDPEETYDIAAAHTRNMRCPTWLGLSRDARIFELCFAVDGEMWDWVQPRLHGYPVSLPESNDAPVRYRFFFGRGIGCVQNLTRRLEDGVLPILRGRLVDGDVQYDITAFVTLEVSRLSTGTVRGTHFLVADGYGIGSTMTPEQQQARESLLPAEMDRDEETVLFYRVEAVNTAAVPRYAWFKAVSPGLQAGASKPSFDGETGFGEYESRRVFCVSRLDGKPLPQEEAAVLLKPGERCVWEFLLPHRPVSRERAMRLMGEDFSARHEECSLFWREKLRSAAQVRLPERRLDEMVRAGLLHLDLVAYGLEPDGPVAATIGVYCPIGSESSPIIQFIDSMGWHGLAQRSLAYFLEKQRSNGFMQNFDNYMLETGAALWSMGEHFRYTRDEEWVRTIAPRLLKACEYILNWRRRNMREELRGRGYGLLDGQVADPADPYHIFMLNGYAYLGLSRASEMLASLDPAEAKKLHEEVEKLKEDIRSAFFENMARSPVVPLGDGTWCSTASPWTEARGPLCLFVEKHNCFTHGTFTARDSLLGPLYLVFQEVLDPADEAAGFLVNYHAELMHARNVALSQPYYSPHARVHLLRREVKPFLKAYYNSFAGLADRETYTFWEHYFHASPHKTHEEGWFLMQTRWMLYMEEGDTLRLLPGIPRAWMASGGRIELNGVASYFGPIFLDVESELEEDTIKATVEVKSRRQPGRVELRMPHPEGRKPIRVQGGIYDARTETVQVEPFRDRVNIALEF